MNSLENYLREEYPFDQADIGEIETALKSVVAVYESRNNFSQDSAWPYELSNSDEVAFSPFSPNTTAMILNALLRFRGHFDASTCVKNYGRYRKNVFLVDDATKVCGPDNIIRASKLLTSSVLKDGKLATKSKTYGDDDIFTLAWLSEISSASWDEISSSHKTDWVPLRKAAAEAVQTKVTDWLKSGDFAKLVAGENSSKPQAHAFPVLRLVQAARRLEIDDTKSYSELYIYFERTLHEQLSFSSIPDSRFDPAELMFCLEGMLICKAGSVDRTVFDRVLEVLTIAQSTSAFWRPVKPFLATAQGLVLFPVSVEIANSLMRACVMYDGDSLHNTYGSRCVSLLRRYWQWLRARSVKVGKDGKDQIGWHSEHVNQSGIIHLWETSQVMEFLLSYRSMLHSHVARTTLVLSRFKEEKWSKIAVEDALAYEPVSSLGDRLRIYEAINTDFLTARHSGKSNNFSMLLYGPPGTGKTTVAESVAKVLDYRLITITVSDFLAIGGGQVEARAKDIFKVLMAQPACVVLFDEIDHFLLDRDSNRYAMQDTVFQFMTPGMLTKINDLRRAKHALFVVATNYEDRIDSAIKRTGRIDKKYLVLPPDAAKRWEMIRTLLVKNSVKHEFGKAAQARLSLDSLFLGYKDIEAAVEEFCHMEEATPDCIRLADLLRLRARTISLEAYQNRFVDEKKMPREPRETPMAEFLCLVAMKLEVEPSWADANKNSAVMACRDCIGSADVESQVRFYAADLSDEKAGFVASLLKTVNYVEPKK